MGVLSALPSEPLQRLNGYKNVLAHVVNAVAALIFMLVAREHIDWSVVLLIGVGSLLGGVVGARGRAPAAAAGAAGVIIVVGLVGIVKIVWFTLTRREPTRLCACRSRSPTRPTRGLPTTSR